MTACDPTPADVLIDLGNSFLKWAFLAPAAPSGPGKAGQPWPLISPPQSIPLQRNWHRSRRLWQSIAGPVRWWVCSVVPAATERLLEQARQRRCLASAHVLSARDVGMEVQVEAPERVGVDRLLAALAARQGKPAAAAAIVVDAGTAITVDWVNPEGAFCGGAILPGPGTAAASLAKATALLPHALVHAGMDPPDLPGRSTVAALQAGLYWGVVGAVREIVTRMRQRHAGPTQIFLAGGWSASLAPNFPDARLEPFLVLRGIAMVAARHHGSLHGVRGVASVQKPGAKDGGIG